VRSCLPCLATVRRDGFAGWHPSEDGNGSITTQPLVVVGDSISVCADVAAGGKIHAAILDPDGESLDEFSADKFDPITETVTDGELVWRDASIGSQKGKLIRLKFTLEGDATLFSLTGLTDPGQPEMSPASQPFSNELAVTLEPPADKKG